MKTLYDLLEALPDDDADELRAAFRRAVKANHPDINPGNAEASERFRRIVRANAILSDTQQRVAYDRMLAVVRLQQSRKPNRSKFSNVIRRLSADSAASAVVAVVLIGGYFMFRPVDGPPLASAQVTEAAMREPAQAPASEPALTPAVEPTQLSDANGRSGQHDQTEIVEAGMKFDTKFMDTDEPAETAGIASAVTTGVATASADHSTAPGFGTQDAEYYRERGILAYRSGDLASALVNFDLAIHLDPGLPDSYIDRGIVFHRLGDLKRALADIAEAKRIDALSRNKNPSVASAP
jgi:curved DNA-binding protein CbpA